MAVDNGDVDDALQREYQLRLHQNLRIGWSMFDTVVEVVDAQIREETKERQPDTTGLMAELVAHVILGFQQRGKEPFLDELESWAAVFLTHAINSYKCAFDLLVEGYPAQALALLRGVMEDASVVQYLAYHPEEASKLSTLRKMMGESKVKDTVASAKYRIGLQKIGDAALANAMSAAHELINVLSDYAHPSLYAMSMLAFQEENGIKPTIGFLSFYNEDNFKRAAYAFMGVYPFLVTALECLVADRLPPWKARNHALLVELHEWVRKSTAANGPITR
jgi:hypothetical protein